MARSDFFQQRLVSLDAYRGLIMIALAYRGFGLADTARRKLAETSPAESEHSFWSAVYYQWEHVEWTGCGFWDLIQPSFMFMVGVAMAYSYLKRRDQGQSYLRMLAHAATRSLILIFLGIFLISNGQRQTDWSLMNVLTQIGLGYTFLFLLWNRPTWLQASAATVLLLGTCGLYTAYPNAGIDPEKGNAEVGVSQKWAQDHLTGLDPHWHKNANVGHAVDRVILNWMPYRDSTPPAPVQAASAVGLGATPADLGMVLSPSALQSRKPEFRYNRGGYQTINFIPSLATMLFGLMAGELLRSGLSAQRKLFVLVGLGVVGLLVGQLLHQTGVCPLVKRIWTPSWALFSTGWCCLILAGLYAVFDVANLQPLAFPLVVVGVNSIAIYCMHMLLTGWTASTLQTHFGQNLFLAWGRDFEPILRMLLVGSTFWLVCAWMYWQRIFIRV